MGGLLSDLRYAARSLRTAPGFTLIAVMTLALGIGANTAIFSVVDRLLLHPLPYPGGDRMVFLWNRTADQQLMFSPDIDQVKRWRAQSHTLSRVEGYSSADLPLTGSGEPTIVHARLISASLTATLGVVPLRGRAFLPEEERRGAPAVVMLSRGFWESHFGSRPEAIGKALTLGGTSYTIVGVMPPDLRLPGWGPQVDLWLPYGPNPSRFGNTTGTSVLGVLRPTVTPREAERELTAIDNAQPNAGPTTPGIVSEASVVARPAADMTGRRVREALYILLGAVALVLLIGCANVANLVLARGASRERALAIRSALGASRGRLVRQLLAENLLLALMGGAVGVGIAAWALDVIAAIRPRDLDQLAAAHLNPLVLGATVGLSLLTVVLFGLAPSLRSSRPALGEMLKDSSAAATVNARGRRLRSLLVSTEVALALVLLTGAGLLVRSVIQLESANVGFNPDRLWALRMELPQSRYRSAASRQEFSQDLVAAARRDPAVEMLTIATNVPPQYGLYMLDDVGVEGRQLDKERIHATITRDFVGASYFSTVGVRLRQGRTFRADGERDSGEMVINMAMAKRYWPGENAIGKRIRFSPSEQWSTVVGVVDEVAAIGLTSDLGRLQVYSPMGFRSGALELIVRLRGDPAPTIAALRRQIAAIDPELPVREVTSAQAALVESISGPRFNMAMLTTFAGLALLLAAVGLYGVISYTVSQMTREIGIRVALGADPHHVVWAAAGHGARPAAIGLAIGVVAALALTRVMRGLIFDLSPRDPLTFVVVAVLFAVVALVASWIPARRAARVDPVVALRQD